MAYLHNLEKIIIFSFNFIDDCTYLFIKFVYLIIKIIQILGAYLPGDSRKMISSLVMA